MIKMTVFCTIPCIFFVIFWPKMGPGKALVPKKKRAPARAFFSIFGQKMVIFDHFSSFLTLFWPSGNWSKIVDFWGQIFIIFSKIFRALKFFIFFKIFQFFHDFSKIFRFFRNFSKIFHFFKIFHIFSKFFKFFVIFQNFSCFFKNFSFF